MLPEAAVDQIADQRADGRVELAGDPALALKRPAVLVPGEPALMLHAHERHASFDQPAGQDAVAPQVAAAVAVEVALRFYADQREAIDAWIARLDALNEREEARWRAAREAFVR